MVALKAEQGRLGLVKAVRDIGVGHRLSLAAESPEGKGQDLVGAVAGEDVLPVQSVPLGDGVVQGGAGGVGVQVQPLHLPRETASSTPGAGGKGLSLVLSFTYF